MSCLTHSHPSLQKSLTVYQGAVHWEGARFRAFRDSGTLNLDVHDFLRSPKMSPWSTSQSRGSVDQMIDGILVQLHFTGGLSGFLKSSCSYLPRCEAAWVVVHLAVIICRMRTIVLGKTREAISTLYMEENHKPKTCPFQGEIYWGYYHIKELEYVSMMSYHYHIHTTSL